MLRKIETVDIVIQQANWKQIAAVLSKCRETLTNCKLQMVVTPLPYGENDPKLSPLLLPNAQRIAIFDVYFYRIWTNKCTKLMLYGTRYIGQDWCQFVIKNCDCSSINSLVLQTLILIFLGTIIGVGILF